MRRWLVLALLMIGAPPAAAAPYADVVNGVVTNVVEWDGVSAYAAPDGGSLIPTAGAAVGSGWGYVGGRFVAPAVLAAQATLSSAFAAGLTITSTATPALDGTYAIDAATQANITAEQVYIATKGTFTNGVSTKAWPDKSGAFHTFPSTTEFTAFAAAVAQYVDGLDTALGTAQQGGTPTWPNASVQIP